MEYRIFYDASGPTSQRRPQTPEVHSAYQDQLDKGTSKVFSFFLSDMMMYTLRFLLGRVTKESCAQPPFAAFSGIIEGIGYL